MFFLRLAVLSILSHPRRSAVIAASVALSVMVMVFVEGMLGGLRVSFFENLLQGTGHLQIHAAGWQDRLDPYSISYLLRDPQGMIRRIERDLTVAPRLAGIEPMLQFGALLVIGDRNVAMVGRAVQPTTGFFANVRKNMLAGSFLPAGAMPGSRGVAISSDIARLLGLGLGDQVIVLVQDSSGSPYYLGYRVTGIFSTGVEQTDEDSFFIDLGEAQGLLDISHSASELRLTLKNPDEAATVARDLSALFSHEKPVLQSWRDIQSGLVSLINLGSIYATVIDVIIALVAATVITSSILMTIFERIPTFGTLRAIGLKRRQLFWILMEEGLVLGLAGSLLGMAVGLPLALYLQVHGLEIGAFSQVLGTSAAYYFVVTTKSALTVFAAGILIAALGYLYGASVSVRMRLLESLEQGA